MNARERIAQALFRQVNPETWNRWDDPDWRSQWLAKADAVLAVLPELLTDEEVMDAAVEMYNKSIRLAPSAAVRRILNAAAKALIEQQEAPS